MNRLCKLAIIVLLLITGIKQISAGCAQSTINSNLTVVLNNMPALVNAANNQLSAVNADTGGQMDLDNPEQWAPAQKIVSNASSLKTLIPAYITSPTTSQLNNIVGEIEALLSEMNALSPYWLILANQTPVPVAAVNSIQSSYNSLSSCSKSNNPTPNTVAYSSALINTLSTNTTTITSNINSNIPHYSDFTGFSSQISNDMAALVATTTAAGFLANANKTVANNNLSHPTLINDLLWNLNQLQATLTGVIASANSYYGANTPSIVGQMKTAITACNNITAVLNSYKSSAGLV